MSSVFLSKKKVGDSITNCFRYQREYKKDWKKVAFSAIFAAHF